MDRDHSMVSGKNIVKSALFPMNWLKLLYVRMGKYYMTLKLGCFRAIGPSNQVKRQGLQEKHTSRRVFFI
jgi:hypothetical protein